MPSVLMLAASPSSRSLLKDVRGLSAGGCSADSGTDWMFIEVTPCVRDRVIAAFRTRPQDMPGRRLHPEGRNNVEKRSRLRPPCGCVTSRLKDERPTRPTEAD